VAQALHRVGIPAVVASRMPLSLRGSTQLTETLYEELIGQLSPLDRALGAVRGRLKEDAERLDWASLQLYAQAGDEAALRPFVIRPYRGLLAFRPEDRRFFFGRSKLEAELLRRVRQAAQGQRSCFQVVAGASGSGKSSLVMAGLVLLLPKEEWDWLVVRPGELARCGPAFVGERSAALQELRSRVHSRWSSEPLPVSGGVFEQELVEEVRRMRQARPARKLLLVLDQFEEVFTLLKSEERQPLVRGAWALARQPELGCVIVATLRVDHFERCGEVLLEDGRRLDTVVYAEEHRIFVAQMGLEELAEAIEQPALKVGLELETGLVDRLCRDVGREPGALPLLEHALDLLWQRRERQRLTHQAYEQMEGRLLVSSRGGGVGEGGRGAWVQLAHETLLRRWKRLERWVEEDWEREQQLRVLERSGPALRSPRAWLQDDPRS
jgi:energy-coupling factor transporter ATP-binding protein EcfA2